MVPVSGRKRQQHPLGADVFSQQHIADELDLDGHLPHIPLRPFRNQVGGHSAIYKFTKRAVCKVSNPFYMISIEWSVIFRALRSA